MDLVLFQAELTTYMLKLLIFKFIMEVQRRRALNATHNIKFCKHKIRIKEQHQSSSLQADCRSS